MNLLMRYYRFVDGVKVEALGCLAFGFLDTDELIVRRYGHSEDDRVPPDAIRCV